MKRIDIPFHHHHRSSAVRPVPMRLPQLSALLSAAACLALACLFASCTADHDPAAAPGDFAPGTVPIILTVPVVATPASAPAPTRAALPGGTPEGQWTEGDPVAVEVNGVMKWYLVASGNGATTARLVPLSTEDPHYWPSSTSPVSVRAWCNGSGGYRKTLPDETYPWSISQNQNDVADGRTGYQRSDFLYAPARDITYAGQQAGTEALTFYHQTARVVIRIRMGGVVTDAKDFLAANITDKVFDHAVFDASLIDLSAGQYSGLKALEDKGYSVAKEILPTPAGYARCYEALVIPQDMKGKKFIEVIDGGGKSYYYTPGAGEAVLQGGYTYTYDITVSEHGSLHVTAAPPIAGWVNDGEGGSGTAVLSPTLIDLAAPPTINDDGAYLLTGRARNVTLSITGGNPTVIVKDLDLDISSIHITGGTPVIRVEGTRNFINNYYNPPIWLDGNDANVHVTGTGVTESGLALGVDGNYPDAAIGTKGVPDGSKGNYRCGNIAISNLTLFASTAVANLPGWGGAAIGTGGGGGNRKCGDITITDAHVKAYAAGGAAAIGFGCAFSTADMTGTTYEMGTIYIRNSTIESGIGQGWNGIYPAHIGSGAVMAENYNVGDIFIDTDKSGTEFFSTFTGGTQADREIVVGFPILPGGRWDWRFQWISSGEGYLNLSWDFVRGLL